MGATAYKSSDERRRVSCGIILMATVLTTLTTSELAAAQDQPSAQIVPVLRSFNIPAQPLPDALALFGRQSGMQVSVDAASARGVASPGVTGSMQADQALEHLLAGTGLTFHLTGNNTAMLEKLPPGSTTGTINLPALQIMGQKQTAGAWDPVDGYVATQGRSATKTDTPILETPQTIHVITKDQLAAQQAESVRSALRYAPGVFVSDDADNRLDSFTVRGFNLDQYLDGLKLQSGTWAVPKVEPYMLERLELLEGPSSVLYGQASPGGLLDMVSKRPTADPVHEIELQTGSYDRIQGAFDLGGSIDKDGQFLYRVTGLARSTDTQVDHTKERRFNIAPALTWRPNDDTSLTLLTSYLHDPDGGFWDLLPYQGTLTSNPNGKISSSFYTGDTGFEKFTRTQYQAGYEFSHRFSDTWQVRQNFRYSNLSMDYAAVQGLTLQSDEQTLNRQAYAANEKLNTIDLDNQAQADFTTGILTHKILLGVDYQRLTWDDFTRLGAAPTLDILDPDYSQNIPRPGVFQDQYETQNQVGVYAQEQLSLGGWRLLLAGREDWASTRLSNHLADTATTQSDMAFTGHVGLSYVFKNGFVPYVSYATSFQPTLGTDFDGNAFKPTTGKQEEVGIKYQPPGINALFTLAAFNLTQDNVSTSDPDHANFSVQTGQVRSRGIEVSAVATPIEGLNLRASYTYLQPKIMKANNNTEGNDLADTPRNLASAWADYTFGEGPAEGFGLGGGIKYGGQMYATNANTQKIPDYVIVDAAVHYDLGAVKKDLAGLKISVNANNLFDKKYVSYCSAIGCRWGLRRSVLATVGYSW